MDTHITTLLALAFACVALALKPSDQLDPCPGEGPRYGDFKVSLYSKPDPEHSAMRRSNPVIRAIYRVVTVWIRSLVHFAPLIAATFVCWPLRLSTVQP